MNTICCPYCDREIDTKNGIITPVFSRSKNRIIEEIKELVCKEFDLPLKMIYLRSRKKEIVRARQVIIYFLNKRKIACLSDIAKCFGEAISDHTTAIHSRNLIKDLMENDEALREKINTLSVSVKEIISNSKTLKK